MPGIQSTPSIILDGSTSAVVPSPILISASEIKFQSFPCYGCIVHLMSTVFRRFLGQWHPPFYSFLLFIRTEIEADHCETSTSRLLAHYGESWGKILVFAFFHHVPYVFDFLRSSQTFPLNVYQRIVYSGGSRPWAKGWPVFCRLPCRLFFFLRFLFLYPKKGEPRSPGPLSQIRLWSIPSFLHWNWFLCQNNSHKACCL